MRVEAQCTAGRGLVQANHAAEMLFVLAGSARLCPQPHLQGGCGGKQAAEGVLGSCGHPLPEGKGVGAVIQRLHLQAQRADFCFLLDNDA